MLVYTFDKDKRDELINLDCKLKQEVKNKDRIAYIFEINGTVYAKYHKDNSIFLFNKMKFA